jgi:hypothetical protein
MKRFITIWDSMKLMYIHFRLTELVGKCLSRVYCNESSPLQHIRHNTDTISIATHTSQQRHPLPRRSSCGRRTGNIRIHNPLQRATAIVMWYSTHVEDVEKKCVKDEPQHVNTTAPLWLIHRLHQGKHKRKKREQFFNTVYLPGYKPMSWVAAGRFHLNAFPFGQHRHSWDQQIFGHPNPDLPTPRHMDQHTPTTALQKHQCNKTRPLLQYRRPHDI